MKFPVISKARAQEIGRAHLASIDVGSEYPHIVREFIVDATMDDVPAGSFVARDDDVYGVFSADGTINTRYAIIDVHTARDIDDIDDIASDDVALVGGRDDVDDCARRDSREHGQLVNLRRAQSEALDSFIADIRHIIDGRSVSYDSAQWGAIETMLEDVVRLMSREA